MDQKMKAAGAMLLMKCALMIEWLTILEHVWAIFPRKTRGIIVNTDMFKDANIKIMQRYFNKMARDNWMHRCFVPNTISMPCWVNVSPYFMNILSVYLFLEELCYEKPSH